MKKIFFCSLVLSLAAAGSYAQCDKTLQLHSSKTDYLNASYQVQKSQDESVVVDITKTTITITPNGDSQKAMSGAIKEVTCDWKVPYKEGKMIIKTDLVDAGGDVKEATITIEAKDGKTTMMAEAKERPDQKIKLEVDTFGEKS